MKLEDVCFLREKLEMVEKLRLEIAVGEAAKDQLRVMRKSLLEKYGLDIEVGDGSSME